MFSFSSINKNRKLLFGIATLWIAWFHSFDLIFSVNEKITFLNLGNLLSWVQLMGSCGVDIFLLLSGAGLYFSFSKNPNLPSFWRKRFLRVFPSSFIVALIISCFSGISNIWIFLARITFLDFYVCKAQDPVFWYVSAILLLYLLFPLFFRIIKKYRYWGLTLIIVISLIITAFVFFLLPGMFYQWEVLLARIPVFATGIVLGQIIEKDMKISNVKALFICLFGILYFLGTMISIAAFPTEFNFIKHYLYLPFSVFLVIIISFVRSHIDVAFINKPLEFLGVYSLEMYLIHQAIYDSMSGRFRFFVDHPLCYALLVFIVSLGFAIVLKHVVDHLINLIKSKKIKSVVK